jgi:hypothetical protein
MAPESSSDLKFEIGHVLFIDIVGYSKVSVNDQHAAVEELNRVVRASEQFQQAEAASRLLEPSSERAQIWLCDISAIQPHEITADYTISVLPFVYSVFVMRLD